MKKDNNRGSTIIVAIEIVLVIFIILGTALAIATSYQKRAVVENEDIGWITVKMKEGNSWYLTSAGMDFYDGIGGIAFFLTLLKIKNIRFVIECID